MRTAIRAYKEERYEDAVVRCRVTLETAFHDKGVVDDGGPRRMVEKADADRLLREPYVSLCLSITSFGGKAAHRRQEITAAEALSVLGCVAVVLQQLYPEDD